MYKWFRDCHTAEEGKQKYRELVKRYHPDNGGSGEELKEISSDFSTWWSRHKDIHTAADGTTYTSENETTETAEDFMEIIRNLSTLSGIEVEICGLWLWISGNTYPVRTQLTSFGCRWSNGKKKWYWTTEAHSKARYKKPTMEQIRKMYGSQKVKLQAKQQLTHNSKS